MVLDDASEEEPEELFPDTGDQGASTNRESKKDREDKLKKMMEDEDADGMLTYPQRLFYPDCTFSHLA